MILILVLILQNRTLSQNPLNPLQYFGAYNINGAWRTYDGHNWTSSAPNFGVSANGDPITTYDGAGNLYYETMFGGVTGCKVIRSTDNGANLVSSCYLQYLEMIKTGWLLIKQQVLYSGYVYTGMTPGNFARTTNLGASWTTTTYIWYSIVTRDNDLHWS